MVVWACVLVMITGGCQSDRKTYAENARLRSDVLQLKEVNESLQQRIAELNLQLQDAASDSADVPAEVQAVVPHVTSIAISRLSHAKDSDDDGKPDTVVIYIVPSDGLGRFTQLAGPLGASVMTVASVGGEPIRLGHVSLTPSEVRDCYRSSLTGTHYTIEVPFDSSAMLPQALQQVVAMVVYADGRTGRTQFTAERTIDLNN